MIKVINAKVHYNPLRERQNIRVISDDGRITLSIPLMFKNGNSYLTLSDRNIVGFFTRDNVEMFLPDFKPEGDAEYFLIEKSYDGYRVYQLRENDAIVSIKDPKVSNAKAFYEAYETPSQIHEITARIVSKLIANVFYKLTEDDKLRKFNLNTKEGIRSFFEYLNSKETIQKYKEKLAGKFSRFRNVKEFKLAFFDPQAGSGTILDTLNDYGIPSVLLGSEIRPLKLEKNGYYVSTGTPFEFFYEMLQRKRILNSYYEGSELRINTSGGYIDTKITPAVAKVITSAFHFYNPPYTNDKYFVINTLKSVPIISERKSEFKSPIVFGLFSASHLDEISYGYLKGYCKRIKAQDTGYTDNKVPKEFLYVVGGIKDVNRTYSNNLEEDYYNTIENFENKIASYLIDKYTQEEIFEMLIDQSLYAEQLGNILISEAEEEKRKLEEGFNHISIKDVFKPLSVLSKAVRNEPIFPDVKTVNDGSINLLRFEDIYTDVELQSIYKESFPDIYNIFVEACKILKKDIPVKEESVDYIISNPENLGLLKFKYLPSRVKIDDRVYEILKENANPDDFELFDKIYNHYTENNEPLYLSVKSYKNINIENGENHISTIAVLTVSDKLSRDLMIVNLPVEKIFDKIGYSTAIHISKHPEFTSTYLKLIRLASEDLINSFTEEERKFLDENLKSVKDVVEVSSQLREKLITNNKDFLKSVFKLQIYTKQVALTVSKNKREKLLSVLEGLSQLFEDYPLQFALSILDKPNEEFKGIYQYTNGLSLKEYFENRLKQMKIFTEKEIQDATDAFVENASTLREIVIGQSLSLSKYVFGYYTSKQILNVINENPELAIELFETLYYKDKKGFALREYQFKEALNAVIKSYLTGKAGHFLGWEMRAGKTLVMATGSYFATLLNGKPSNFFVKSNNVFDIAGQISRHLPHVIKNVIIFPTNAEDFNEEKVEEIFSSMAFVNPFAFPDMFKGKGNSVRNYLERNDLANIERYSKEEFDVSTALKEIPQLEELTNLQNVDKNYLKAVIRYLYENKNDLNTNSKGFKEFIEYYKKLDEKLGDGIKTDKKIRLISKDKYMYSFSFLINRDKKVLTSSRNYVISTNANVEFEPVRDIHTDVKLEKDYVIISSNKINELANKGINIDFTNAIEIVRTPERVYYALDDIQIIPILEENDISYKRLSRVLNASVDEDGLDIKAFLHNISTSLSSDGICEINIPAIIPYKGSIPNFKDGMTKIVAEVTSTSRSIKTKLRELHYEYDLEKYPNLKLFEGLKSNKSKIVYGFDSINGDNFITDELDTSSNIESTSLRFISSVKAPYKVGATGSPTNGDIGNTVGLLGVISGVPVEVLEKSMLSIRERYSIKEIEGKKYEGVFALIVRVVKGLLDKNPKLAYNLFNANIEAREFINDLLHYAHALDVYIGEEEGYLIEKIQTDKINKFTRDAINKFIISMHKRVNEVNTYSEYNVKEVIIDAMNKELERLGVIKKGVGTTNPLFAKAITDASGVSMKSREVLKGVVETLNVKDDLTVDIIEYRKSGKTSDKIARILSGEGRIYKEDKPETDLRYIYDRVIHESHDLRLFYDLVVSVAGMLEKEITSLSSEFSEELLELVSQTGKTTENGLRDVVRFLLTGDERLSSIDDEKIKLGKEFLEAFTWLTIRVAKISDDKNDDRESAQPFGTNLIIRLDKELAKSENENNRFIQIFKTLGDYAFVKEIGRGSSIEFLTTFNEITSKLKTDVFNVRFIKDYEKLFDPSTYYVNVNLAGGISDKYEYEYKLKKVGSDDEELISIVTDRGLMETIDTLMLDGEDFLLPVSRVQGIPVLLIRMFENAMKNQSEKYNVVIRSDDKRIKEFLKSVEIPENVKVKLVSTNAELEKEIMSMKNNDSTNIVVAGAKAISRGIDLSFFDTMVLAGSLDANAREFTQLLARLYNNDPTCVNKNIYLYGTSVKFGFIGDRQYLTLSPVLVQKLKLYRTAIFNKQLLQGSTELVSLNSGAMMPLTKGVEILKEINEKKMEKINAIELTWHNF